MRTKGLVIANDDRNSQVMVYRAEACGSCESCGGCGQSKPTPVWIENSLNAQPGEMVTIEMDNGAFVRNTMKIYLLPLFMFVAGLLLTSLVLEKMERPNEVLSLVGGFAFLAVFLLVGRLLDKKAEKEPLLRMIKVQSIEESFAEQ